MKISDYINRNSYNFIPLCCKVDVLLIIETISENWLRNKLVRVDILKKYEDKVFLKELIKINVILIFTI